MGQVEGSVGVAITFLLSMMIILLSFFTLGRQMIVSYGNISDSWTTLRKFSTEQANTRLTGPIGLSVSATSTVEIILVNEGSVTIGRFADWNVIFEVQKASGFEVLYLTYTESASPGANEWTDKGIYMNASTLKAEIIDIGTLNPNEELIVLANPSPSVVATKYNRATFVTPNGITTKVIFRVVP